VSQGPLLLLCAFVLSGCDLREITIAEPDDVVVAEIVLRAGSPVQTAYLHRTSALGSARVFDAIVTVTDIDSGDVTRFEAEADSLCLSPVAPVPDASTGTCYVADREALSVVPGRTYAARVELRDGRSMTGVTTVPQAFDIYVPDNTPCHLPPASTIALVWTPSAGTAAYLLQTRMHGLREALRATGLVVEGSGPVRLTGLSITATDTTLNFPGEIGLFSRFDDSLHPILVAIQDGLPPGVTTEMAVAAVDPNYVNWIRGGTFNPSGTVRISSLTGDGVGVFGSVVVRHLEIHTAGQAQLPPCE
jgi:hypothetical protein